VPEVVIIAGPNGAGKTTFADEYLAARLRHFEFVNADEIAREVALQGLPQPHADTRAARIMLDRINHLVATDVDFVFETTLATRTYAQKIPQWQRSGYKVSLVYLRLSSVEASIARVRRRVDAGGHEIPQQTVRRRFDKSLTYLEDIYKPIVEEWYIWNSLEGTFVPAESWNRT
jgi:predicted ABC-type ATPase